MTHTDRPDEVLRRPRRCALYVPGHTVHFIQARHGWEQPQLREAARLVAIEGNLLVLKLRRGERRYRNHQPERLAEAVERFGAEVAVQERLGLLNVPHGSGTYLFCIARAEEPWRQCVADGPIGPLDAESAAGVLERFGGFYARPLPAEGSEGA